MKLPPLQEKKHQSSKGSLEEKGEWKGRRGETSLRTLHVAFGYGIGRPLSLGGGWEELFEVSVGSMLWVGGGEDVPAHLLGGFVGVEVRDLD